MAKLKKWPALPAMTHGPVGPVQVTVAGDGFPHVETPMGSYMTMPRVIRVAPGMPPDVTWLTFYHEFVEMALEDSGLQNIFRRKRYAHLKEAVCDAIALALLAQMKAEHGL